MKQSNIAILVYIAGVIIGALFFDIWGAETTPQKTISVFIWTIIFIIALFFTDKNEKK